MTLYQSDSEVAIEFDALEDYWTCHRVRCAGIWTTEKFAREVGRHFSMWYPIRCQAMTHIRWPFCRRCGFPDPYRQRQLER